MDKKMTGLVILFDQLVIYVFFSFFFFLEEVMSVISLFKHAFHTYANTMLHNSLKVSILVCT